MLWSVVKVLWGVIKVFWAVVQVLLGIVRAFWAFVQVLLGIVRAFWAFVQVLWGVFKFLWDVFRVKWGISRVSYVVPQQPIRSQECCTQQMREKRNFGWIKRGSNRFCVKLESAHFVYRDQAKYPIKKFQERYFPNKKT